MDLIIAASVVTNAALIVFTMGLVDSYTEYTRFWIFIGFQWVVFGLQYVIRASVPDVPEEVKVQVERADFFNRKLIEREEDPELIEESASGRTVSARYNLGMAGDALAGFVNGLIRKTIMTSLSPGPADQL